MEVVSFLVRCERCLVILVAHYLPSELSRCLPKWLGRVNEPGSSLLLCMGPETKRQVQSWRSGDTPCLWVLHSSPRHSNRRALADAGGTSTTLPARRPRPSCPFPQVF